LPESLSIDPNSRCGIDEAGRGPLAGPLVVAGVVLKGPIDGLDDSKKLTESRREMLYEKIVANSRFVVLEYGAALIDSEGISKLLGRALCTIKKQLEANSYLFDGPCSFGAEGIETLVKADGKIAEVAAASIIAKVTRDRIMQALDMQYPQYGFAGHKGYGTKAHIEALRKYGRSLEHRKSFRVKALDEPPLF